jgi:hypothetical protein
VNKTSILWSETESINKGRTVFCSELAVTPEKHIGHILHIPRQFNISGLADMTSARSL